jgi:hypothetical protein
MDFYAPNPALILKVKALKLKDKAYNMTYMARFNSAKVDLSTWNLTLSVLIKYNEAFLTNLTEIQTIILKDINASELINEKSIYRCVPKTFHFSIINFVSMTGCSREDFEYMLKAKKAEIIQAVEKDKAAFNECVLEEPRLYPPIDKEGEKSIAFNFNMARNGSALKKDEVDNMLPSLSAIFSPNYEIKVVPVIINLVRFFREPDAKETHIITMNMKSNGIKKLMKKASFNIEILSLVVSNMYLSNKNPEIEIFSLK